MDTKIIEERKAKSLLRYKKRLAKERDIKEGRQFFAKNKLPLLAAYPSDRPGAVYLTFMPIEKDVLRVAVTMRSKKDNESFRKARGILGHRIRTTEAFDIVATAPENTFIAKDGGWRYKDIYQALNTITPKELLLRDNCPRWMKNVLAESNLGLPSLDFQDYRMFRHMTDLWPYDAMQIAQRYYERTWPAPVTT